MSQVSIVTLSKNTAAETGVCASEYGDLQITWQGDVLLGVTRAAKVTTPSVEAANWWKKITTNQPVKVALSGTDFQNDVWKALTQLPEGKTTTYGELAKVVGKPTAYRAVGNAVGANPFFYLIPCHRVLAANGKIGGYAWGPELKRSILSKEGIAV